MLTPLMKTPTKNDQFVIDMIESLEKQGVKDIAKTMRELWRSFEVMDKGVKVSFD